MDRPRGTGAEDAPRRLVVLGGGPAGLGLAQAVRSLGSAQVVFLSRAARLLPQLEPFVGDLVLARLRDLAATTGGSLHARGCTGGPPSWSARTHVVVSATFVGQDVADLVHAATIAVVGRVPLDTLRHAVPSFPTLSEAWLLLSTSTGPGTAEGRPPLAARRQRRPRPPPLAPLCTVRRQGGRAERDAAWI